MPTSAPGNSRPGIGLRRQGFTLLELLVVVAIIALAAGLSVVALRDSTAMRLQEEAARLSALLDAARVESRGSGRAVTWRPLAPGQTTASGARADFVFEPPLAVEAASLGGPTAWPTRWLNDGTTAEVVGAPRLVLGPEPLISPQRVVVRLGGRQLQLQTDGLGPFRLEEAPR